MHTTRQLQDLDLEKANQQACVQAIRGLAQVGFGAFTYLGKTLLGACFGSERMIANGVSQGAISIHNGLTHVKHGIARLTALEASSSK